MSEAYTKRGECDGILLFLYMLSGLFFLVFQQGLAIMAKAIDLQIVPGDGKILGDKGVRQLLERTAVQRYHFVAMRTDGVVAVLMRRELIKGHIAVGEQGTGHQALGKEKIQGAIDGRHPDVLLAAACLCRDLSGGQRFAGG